MNQVDDECDKCEFKAKWKGDFTKHKQPKHEGVRYECDPCEYKNHLINHKKSKHEEVRYQCGQCKYKVALQS